MEKSIRYEKLEGVESLLNVYKKMIQEEYENNKNMLSIAGIDSAVKICNEFYWISEEGVIKRKKTVEKE